MNGVDSNGSTPLYLQTGPVRPGTCQGQSQFEKDTAHCAGSYQEPCSVSQGNALVCGPRGYHIMLFDLLSPFNAGDAPPPLYVDVRESWKTVAIAAKVAPIGAPRTRWGYRPRLCGWSPCRRWFNHRLRQGLGTGVPQMMVHGVGRHLSRIERI